MNEQLIASIEKFAGPPRAKTFGAAARLFLERGLWHICETGCYRGIPADGMSTLILSLLRKEVNGKFCSIDTSAESLKAAYEMLKANGEDPDAVSFINRDSVLVLREIEHVDFLYLDSFDHDPRNPGPCQRHQMAELGAVYGTLTEKAIILLDDNDTVSGGKPFLTSRFLMERGWKLVGDGLQFLFARQ